MRPERILGFFFMFRPNRTSEATELFWDYEQFMEMERRLDPNQPQQPEDPNVVPPIARTGVQRTGRVYLVLAMVL
jgi:hypothetical protein